MCGSGGTSSGGESYERVVVVVAHTFLSYLRYFNNTCIIEDGWDYITGPSSCELTNKSSIGIVTHDNTVVVNGMWLKVKLHMMFFFSFFS